MIEYLEQILIERDVVYFFHLQSDYRTIEPDIEWSLFSQAYWRVVSDDVMGLPGGRLLVYGSLSIIITAGICHAMNIGLPLGNSIDGYLPPLRRASLSDSLGERLRIAAVESLSLAVLDQGVRDIDRAARMPEQFKWVHEDVVGRYFRTGLRSSVS